MENKAAVVTGGAGANAGKSGSAITTKLSDEGYGVAIWDIACDEGSQLAEELSKEGRDVIFLECDVREPDQVQEATEATLKHFGKVSLLVNNAFWQTDEQVALHEASLASWDENLSSNLRCHFLVCKALIPHLTKLRKSAIVNISSTGAHRGEDGYAAYNAAKAGLESLTRSIATQYGRDGLRCNCVVPGLVLDPQISDYLTQDPETKTLFDLIDRNMLLAQDHGDGSCVADAVYFLASDESRYMTGHSLILDGGTSNHLPQWADLRVHALSQKA